MEITEDLKLSYVITVYNKSEFLADTIQSLKNQKTQCLQEFIFVDDASTDNSLQVIREHTKGLQNVHIIKNKKNKGPSIRLNQGVRKSSGNYILLIDADDILSKNAANIMLKKALSENADFIYGKRKKTNLSGKELLELPESYKDKYTISTSALTTVLDRNIHGISHLISKELYTKSGGCDEKIFIQDESLPLRLGLHATKLIIIEEAITYAPLLTFNNLSINKDQQHHDRFLAQVNFLTCFAKQVPAALLKKLYKRAVSSWWKYQKNHANLIKKIYSFIFYTVTQLFNPKPNLHILETLKKDFTSHNIRTINL